MKINAHVYEILATLGKSSTRYLGIGVQEGVCVEGVVRANPHIEVTLCDTWGPIDGGTDRGSHDHVEHRLIEAGHLGLRTYLDGRSETLIPALPRQPLFDLVFVDGAHDESSAHGDLTEVWPRVDFNGARGLKGCVVVHDIWMPSVMAALSRWARETDGIDRIELYPEGTGTAIVRKQP